MLILDEDWIYWQENFRQEQKELQERDLGGVGVKKGNKGEQEEEFEFSLEEVLSKYSDFLNPSNQGDDSEDQEHDSMSDLGSSEPNVDNWLKDIIPSLRDKDEDEILAQYDPEFEGSKYFEISTDQKHHDLLRELQLL